MMQKKDGQTHTGCTVQPITIPNLLPDIAHCSPSHAPEQGKKTGLQHKAPKTVTWAFENNGEKTKQEEEKVTQEVLEQRRLQKLEKAGIKVLPAAVRYSRSERTRGHEVCCWLLLLCSLMRSCGGDSVCGLL